MKFKFLSLLLAGAIAAPIFSAENFTVVQRLQRSNRVFYGTVTLEDLTHTDRFEGQYFKIVHGKSNEAISFFEQDKDLVLKAATTYFHLTRARSFWIEQIGSQVPLAQGQITVRLDIPNLFDELGHFAHDNKSPQYNNALSIPGGKTPSWVPSDRQDEWGAEIWFRPMKKISTKEISETIGTNPLQAALEAAEKPFLGFAQDYFTFSTMEHIFYPTYVARPFHHDIIRLVGTIAITKTIVEASRHMDSLFMEKWYYLDTAMVPEIIYHEYAHLVLSDHLKLSHSTPVVEGLADYFAAVQSGKRKVYGKVPHRSNAVPKDTNHKRPYGHWDESNRNATADFVLAVLWDVRETLGANSGDKVVYEARTMLKTESATIADHLLRSVLEACKKVCENPRRDRLKLYETFKQRGF
jgi:hypothetical protein